MILSYFILSYVGIPDASKEVRLLLLVTLIFYLEYHGLAVGREIYVKNACLNLRNLLKSITKMEILYFDLT